MASRQLEEKLMPVTPAFEDAELKNNLAALFAEYPAHFRPHLYYYNPTTGASVDINGYEGVSAASVIKLPVLLQFFRMVDRGLISPDSSLLYTDFLRGGGAGELQYKPSGEVYSAREIATRMIQISDNTCTNMMVYSLGGIERVRQAWDSLGLKRIAIRNWLPDLEGTNIVSPYELVTMLYNLDQGLLLRPESREAALEILKGTHNRRLLPARLPEGTIIAHKTGDIGTVLGDAGIVFLPETNHRYFVSIQVERPYNDYTARDIIQRASRMIYDRAWATRSESPAAGQTTSSLALSPSSQSL
jgi:beta-lactamase class A